MVRSKNIVTPFIVTVLFFNNSFSQEKNTSAHRTEQNQSLFTITNFNWQSEGQDVLAILKESWHICITGNYNEELALSLLREKKSITDHQKPLTIKILKTDKNIAGFITYSYTPPSADNPKAVGLIEMLAIAQPWRRSGGATMLLHDAITDLTTIGAESINIYVNPENSSAQQCYQKLGFTFAHYYVEEDMVFTKVVNR